MVWNMNNEFWGNCAECKHEWRVCELPMDMDEFVKTCDNTACPSCHGRKIYVGKRKENQK